MKTTGDGIHAVFADPLGAVRAAVALQLALADADATGGIPLRVRCGLHAGVDARRDNDFFGNAVNRAARVMSAAHGGQILVSQAVAALVARPAAAGLSLRDLGQVRLRGLAEPGAGLPDRAPGAAAAVSRRCGRSRRRRTTCRSS